MAQSQEANGGRPIRVDWSYDPARSAITLSGCALAQYSAHVSIRRRRLSNKSLRRYATSTLLPTTCASAVSETSLGKSVRSAAQSRKLDRKPCTVTLL